VSAAGAAAAAAAGVHERSTCKQKGEERGEETYQRAADPQVGVKRGGVKRGGVREAYQ
jgi:hypothetical protein